MNNGKMMWIVAISNTEIRETNYKKIMATPKENIATEVLTGRGYNVL